MVALGRTYSRDPAEVTAHARAFVRGMHAAGVLTALKHFPGHGSSRVDSHHGFTDVTDTANLRIELAPYRALIAEGLADSVMPAHVFNRRLDPWHPASLSWYTVRRLLRGRLGFKGVVVSDDLLMGAITQHYGVEDAALLALGAGVDILLIAQNNARRDDRGRGAGGRGHQPRRRRRAPSPKPGARSRARSTPSAPLSRRRSDSTR